MDLINSFFHLNTNIHFDGCAFILYCGLFFAHLNNKTKYNKMTRILSDILLMGVISSACSFIASIAFFIFPNKSWIRVIVYLLKHAELTITLIMIQGNSFYFYFSNGIEFIVRRHRRIYIFNFICFILGALIITSNIFFKELFYIDENLNVLYGSKYYLFCIELIVLLLKDVITLCCCRKYIANKNQFYFLIPYFVLITFVIYNCFNYEAPQKLFIFAIYMFIVMSYAQRQDLMINPLYAAKSSHAFFSECDRIITMTSKATVCFIKIRNYKNLKLYLGQSSYMEMLKTISRLIILIIDANKTYGSVYYLNHGVYTIIIPNELSFKGNRIYNEINKILRQEVSISNLKILCDVRICVASIPTDIKSLHYLREFAKKFYHIIPKREEIVFISEISNDKEYIIKNHMKDIVERALENDYFEVVYQPIYDVKEKKYIAADTFVQINDPEYGIIPSEMFETYVDQNGFMHFLSGKIYDKICHFIASEEFKNSDLKYINTSLTPNQCLLVNFKNKVLNRLQKYQISTEEIKFKITEKITAVHSEIIESKLNQLHEAGFHFVLDGYGMGYSNIKNVVSLPFDVFKLDKNFVSKYSDSSFKIVIESTVTMFKNLNKQVQVEGIENIDRFDTFKSLGCDLIQGCKYLDENIPDYMDSDALIDFVKKMNLK